MTHPMRRGRSYGAILMVIVTLMLTDELLAEKLDPAAIADDIALASASLAHLHAGYTRFASATTLQTAFADVVATAAAQDGFTTEQFYVALSRALAAIRCNHTKAELPAGLARRRANLPIYLPFRWELVGADNRAIVSAPIDGIDIAVGDEVLAIDGVALSEWAERVMPLVPVDGYNDHARIVELAYSTEFPGGAIEYFGALIRTPGATAELELADADGTRRTVVVPRLTYREWQSHLAATGGLRRDFRDAVSLTFRGDRLAVLRVATFVNYRRPLDPATLFDPLFSALAARDVETLVLDLRSNRGGSDDAQIALFERLLVEPMRLLRDVVAPARTLGPADGHVSSWDDRAMAMRDADYQPLPNGRFRIDAGWVGRPLQWLHPHPLAFKGRLIVLIDASLSSGSNHLVSRLRERPAVTLVGQPGGGNAAGVTAGVLYTLTLPASGIRIRIPAWRQLVDRDGLIDGRGVTPDIVVVPTVAAWRAGDDKALATALALASGR